MEDAEIAEAAQRQAGQSGDRQRNPEMKSAFQDCEASPRFAVWRHTKIAEGAQR